MSVKTWAASGAVVATVAGVLTVWTTLGFPTLALSTDIERLDREQIEIAIRLYEDQLDRLIIRLANLQNDGVPTYNPELRALERQIDRVQTNLTGARSRRIDLGR